MVRLLTPLLAVTLATGSVLASFNEYQDYQRRSVPDFNSNQVQARAERGLVDMPVPYHPGHFRYHRFVCTADLCHLHSRGFEDDEDLFVRDIDTFDDLEAREPFDIGLAAKEFEFGEKMFTHKSGNDARRSPWTFRIHPRGFEDEEDLFERDIDAFYDLEAREPWNYKPIVKVVDKGKKYLTDPRTKKYAKRFGNFLNGVGIVQQIASFANSTFRH